MAIYPIGVSLFVILLLLLLLFYTYKLLLFSLTIVIITELIAAIVKWGDDLRQEMMCWQLLVQFQNIWREESVDLWIRPYVSVIQTSL